MIFAQHGSRRAPHVFFDVLEEERYSETLDRHFVHRVLRIGYNYKGLTEIGGLVVRPEFRAPPRAARPAAVVRALPLHRAPPGRVSRRGALRADAAARARRHQPAVGVAGQAVHRALATRRPIGCRRTTRSSSGRCFPQDPLYASLLPAARAGADRPGGPEHPGRRAACCARSASATRTASTRSTAARTFTPAPTTSRWSATRAAARVAVAEPAAAPGAASSRVPGRARAAGAALFVARAA